MILFQVLTMNAQAAFLYRRLYSSPRSNLPTEAAKVVAMHGAGDCRRAAGVFDPLGHVFQYPSKL